MLERSRGERSRRLRPVDRRYDEEGEGHDEGERGNDARRGTVSAWLLRITRNLALDAARLRRAEVIDPDDLTSLAAPTDATGVEDAAVTSDSAAAVRVALQRLPAEQARALLLAAYYGRTAEEISRSEGIPLGTAKTRIRLGLRKIRALLMAPAEETQ